MAVFYALFCLLCSAGNDFVFKLFARKPRTRGIFCLLIGLVWGILTVACFNIDWSTWKAVAIWGSVIGFFSISANLLLIESMGFQSAGVCSTIYRLNLVPVVFGAWFLLGEKVSWVQWLGIALAIGAVLCFLTLPDASDSKDRKLARLGILMVVIAAFLRAGMGLSYKFAYKAGADEFGITAVIAVYWIIGGLLYALFRERKQVKMDKSLLFYGSLSGIFVAGITIFMALALKEGNASVALPIAQMSFPVTFLLSILCLKETVTRWKVIGVILSIAAVLLLCMAK
ncbi:MAG: EamA family transporter [Lentisphaeria bacterium]|nr:EamA family transporter [Lentisphaeria bacterium]